MKEIRYTKLKLQIFLYAKQIQILRPNQTIKQGLILLINVEFSYH